MDPNKCDNEVYTKGVSVGLFAMSKQQAEEYCAQKTKLTGLKHDWHYVGGRVHIKRLQSLEELPKLEFTADHVKYVQHYRGRCRDCADTNGICPNSGLPCADGDKAIQFVLDALTYGVNHGYVTNPVKVSNG